MVEKRAQLSPACPTVSSGYEGTLQASLTYDPLGRLFQNSGDTDGTTRFHYDGITVTVY